MTRDRALQKVLRCLRLASSSNPYEAAAALRQARKLMAEYGLSEDDAHNAAFGEAAGATRCRGAALPRSLAWLSTVLADGFRCSPVVVRVQRPDGRGVTTKVVFIGANADAKVAAYAFDVLRRQLETDSAKHTARLRKRTTKLVRGEAFAIGFVAAVKEQFPAAEMDAPARSALQRAVETRFPVTTSNGSRAVATKGARATDYNAGWIAGQAARVNAGVGSQRGAPQLSYDGANG